MGYKSQNIISVGIAMFHQFFPNILAMYFSNNNQQVSTDAPQVYRDPGLFMLMVQDNCDTDIHPFG